MIIMPKETLIWASITKQMYLVYPHTYEKEFLHEKLIFKLMSKGS